MTSQPPKTPNSKQNALKVTWSANLHNLPSHKPKGPTATTCETPAPDTLTPRRLHRSRRSVPSFFPSLHHSASRDSEIQDLDVCENFEDSCSSPNVALRRHPDLPSDLRPHVNSTMPSSVAYSETRTLPSGLGRSLNAAPRFTESDSSPLYLDEGRPRNDDIFLNIAKTDSARRDSLGRSDFRRVSAPPPNKTWLPAQRTMAQHHSTSMVDDIDRSKQS